MVLTAAANSGEGGVIVTPLTEVVQINTSNAFPDGVIGFGSQGINPGESVVMTWVKDGLVEDFTIPNLDQNEADLETSIRFGNLDSIDEATFAIQQKVGSKVAAVKVTALATNTENGDLGGNFFDHVGNAATIGGAGDDVIVIIDSVTLMRGDLEITRTADGTFAGTDVVINFVSAADAGASGGTLFEGQFVATGVEAGDMFTYHTVSVTERLVVTGVSGNVDIGGFSTSQTGGAIAPIGDAFVIEDAGPLASVVADVDPGELDLLFRNLDETIAPDGDNIANGGENYAAGETPDFNGDLDDVPIADGDPKNGPVWKTAPLSSEAIGRLDTTLAAGGLAALFDTVGTSFGTDLEGDLGSGDGRSDSLSLSLASAQLTNLVATQVFGSTIDIPALDAATARAVWLVATGDPNVVEGRIAGADNVINGGPDEYVILRITLVEPTADPADAYLVYENFAPVVHGNTALSDEELNVLLDSTATEALQLRYDVEVKDKDGDTDSAFALVTLIDDTKTVFSIDDDGPSSGAAGDTVPLWEDGLTPDGNSDHPFENPDEAETTTTLNVDIADQVIGGSDGVFGFGFKDDVASIGTLTAQGITSGGVDLVYTVEKDISGPDTDDKLTARKGPAGDIIFTVAMGEDGLADVTLVGPVDHAQALSGQPDEDEVEIDLTDLLEAFEGDNDLISFQLRALVLNIEDDAPLIDPINDLDVDLALLDTDSDKDFLHYGADGPGGFIITAFTNLPNDPDIWGTITETLSPDKQTVQYHSSIYGNMFKLEIDGGATGTGTGEVLFTVQSDPPLVLNPVDFAGVDPGGPVEEILVPIMGGNSVTFDGFLFTDPDFAGSANLQGVFDGGGDKEEPDADAPFDDVNVSTQGVGIDDQQIDPHEGLALFFTNDVEGIQLTFDGGTGAGSSFDIRIELYDDNVFVDGFDFVESLPKGNNDLVLDILPGVSFDEAYIVAEFENSSNGVRIPLIQTFEKADLSDFDLTFTVEEFDNDHDALGDPDGDSVTDTFNVHVEADGIL
jgi:hypothetical protein